MRNKTLNWGVIGAGGIADRRTIPGMLETNNCKLTAVMEIDANKSKALADKYNAEFYCTTAEELISNPKVDAVYIASPINYHYDQIINAARAKKHILCEKPIALSCEKAEKAIEICKQNNVLAAAGFMMRYHSLHKTMKQIISNGEIGQIVSCRFQMSCWFPFIEGNWRQQKALSGGGALIDMGIHCIDLAEYILGSEVEKVSAFCETKTFNYEIEDSSNIMLRNKKGAVIYIDNNYNVPDDAVGSRVEIFGTKGSLIAEGTLGQTDTGTLRCVYAEEQGYNALQTRKISTTEIIEAENRNLYAEELESFAESVIKNKEVNVPLSSALQAQKVLDAAYSASKLEKTVYLEEI